MWRGESSGWNERKNEKKVKNEKNPPRGGRIGLFEAEAHALGFFGAAGFADDGLVAALALRDGLRKTHLGFLEGHDAALEDPTIETADEVFVGLVLIFSSNFDCHIEGIIPKTERNDKADFRENYSIMGERRKNDYIDGARRFG